MQPVSGGTGGPAPLWFSSSSCAARPILFGECSLLLRYSGLRIGETVSCSVDRLADGKLRLYTKKPGLTFTALCRISLCVNWTQSPV